MEGKKTDRKGNVVMINRSLAFLLGLFLVVGLCACGGSTDSPTPPATAETEEAAEEQTEPVQEEAPVEQGPAFHDGILETGDVRFEITDWKVIPVGQTGNEYGSKPVIAFWYNVTNVSGKQQVTPMASWIAMFQAFQDTDPNLVNELNVGMLPDDAFLYTQMEQIKPGGTTQCAVSYELDSETVPVVLKAGSLFGGPGYGEQTFEIAQ